MLKRVASAVVAAGLSLSVLPAHAVPAEAGSAGPDPRLVGEAEAIRYYDLFVGEYFEQDIDPFDDGGPMRYEIAPNSLLPKGLALDPDTGVVKGTPEEEVIQLTIFQVTDLDNGEQRNHVEFFLVNPKRADVPVPGVPVPGVPVPGVPVPDVPVPGGPTS